MIRKTTLWRPCKICERYFNPSSKASRTCNLCLKKIKIKLIENNRLRLRLLKGGKTE
jgi:hypothetical protein